MALPTAGICSHDDGGTPLNQGAANPPVTPRADAADDFIDCSFAGPLSVGDSIVLTYWAQTQHSSQLVPFLSPAAHNPDRVENIADVTRYTGVSGGSLAWDTGDDRVEYLVFTPYIEVDLTIGSAVSGVDTCDVAGDEDASTPEVNYSVRYNNYTRYNNSWNIHPWPNTAVYSSSGTYDHWLSSGGSAVPGYYVEPEYVGAAYDTVFTLTMPPGVSYVLGSAEYQRFVPVASAVSIPDPVVTVVGGSQVLTWDTTDPTFVTVLNDTLYPYYYGFESASSGQPTQEQIVVGGSIVTPGEQFWTAGDTASVTMQSYDQLGEEDRSEDTATSLHDYVEADTVGCGSRPGSNLTKSPDSPHTTSSGALIDSESLDSATEVEFFTINWSSYSDVTDVYFVDQLPPGVLYAGDPNDPATYLTDPTTTIPVSMWPPAAQASGNFLDTQTVDYTTTPSPTVYWGPFTIPDSNGQDFQIQVPVRRVDPVIESMWDTSVQNIAHIATGTPGDFTPIDTDDGEMWLPVRREFRRSTSPSTTGNSATRTAVRWLLTAAFMATRWN